MSRDELWHTGTIEELENVTSIQEFALTPESSSGLQYMEDVFSADEMTREENEELEVLLQSLKKSDDVALPESGVYFDALEARILGALDSAIEHGEVEDRAPKQKIPVQEINPVAARAAMTRASSRRAQAIRAGQMVMLVGVAIVMTGKWLIAPSPARPMLAKTEQSTDLAGSSALRATHAAAPKVLASTVMSFEMNDDLALDIAARKIAARHAKY